MDSYLFHVINNFAGKWISLDTLAIFFASYFEYFLLFFLVCFLAINFRKNWHMVFSALFSAFVSRFVFCSAVRMLWFRPRPFVENSVNLLMDYNAKESSFPSGHASFYFALSTVIYLYNKKIGILFYAFTILMTLSRVFVGIHWPSDILFGALLGVITGLAGDRLIKKYLFSYKK